jgi:hypothetical protein
MFCPNRGREVATPQTGCELALYEGTEVVDRASGPYDLDLLLQDVLRFSRR